MVGAVGNDAFAGEALAGLREAGVRDRWLPKDAPTGVALITVDAAGETTIVVAPGANAELRPEELSLASRRGRALPAGDSRRDGRACGRGRAALLPQRRARTRRRARRRADDRQPTRARSARRRAAGSSASRSAPKAPSCSRTASRSRAPRRRPSRRSTGPAPATRSRRASSSRSSRAATAKRRCAAHASPVRWQHPVPGAQSSMPTAEEVDALL